MPKKRKEEEEMDLGSLDLAEEEDPMAESEEGEAELGLEDAEAGELSPAADLSDEDLMAEIEKRGLMSKLSGKEEDLEEEQYI
jgi:hypothetical protein